MNKNRYVKMGMNVLFILFFFVLSSCVSQKKKGEVSKLGKFYHNTTALYNGYFNANELMETSVNELKETFQDNYNEILPIYEEVALSNPESVAEKMNKAIEKVSIVATVHEPSQWVDDCYIVIGKAQYLQQNYESAQETFEYFIEEFDPSNTRRKLSKKKKSSKKKSSKKKTTKKKKSTKKSTKKKSTKKKKETKTEKEARLAKEKIEAEAAAAKEKKLAETTEINRGKNGIFKHQDAYPEGLLWLSRTYIEREKYNLVDFYLNKIADLSDVPNEVLKEVPVARAHNSISQGKYAEAIGYLEIAIPLEKDKKRRARLIYIQSQLYQKQGNKQMAFKGFNQVIDMKPDFIMEFNAGLNMLKNSMVNGDRTIAEVQSKLEKMLKEEKFAQFQDQIYYTLGEIYFEQGDVDTAVPNYQKSIKFNNGNDIQLTESYYKLANIFYDKEDYVMSKNYYDSTATVINKSDDRFFEVEAFSKNLSKIAENILTIQLQDSLIRLSEKTPEERAEIATKIKKANLLAAANSKKTDDDNTIVGNSRIRSIPSTKLGGPVSTFFAYDDVKKESGKSDFERLYGRRVLEDNWRRINKTSTNTTFEDISKNDDLELTEDEINEIMKDVPLTPDALNQSKTKIRVALFELGVLYREKIQNYNKAISTHESLQSRFPGSEKEPDALYYLYLSNLDIQNQPQAQYYLNQLKTKYPEEKYTLALTDPSYVDNFLKESKIQEKMYSETYEKFEGGDFETVIINEKKAEEKFTGNNTFGSKYALLSAMATGKMEGKEAYISSLKTMIATYPNTPEQTRAKEILRFLSGDLEAFASIDENEAVQDFEENADKLHYVIVVVNEKGSDDLNAAKISISNYNRKYHKVEKIKISSSTLSKENKTEVILMRSFDSKEIAMKYYNEVTRNKKEFMETNVNYEVFAITQQNFREIMKKKSVKEYEIFFKEKYLN